MLFSYTKIPRSCADNKYSTAIPGLAELKWDVAEYIKYGKENAINGKWMKQLENASARFHISRYEALQLQMQQTVEKLYGNQIDSIDAAMKREYLDGYYHTAFEIQKGIGVGWDIAEIDEKSLQAVINKPWSTDGKTFSDRVWQNKSQLLNELQTQMVQNIMLGRSPAASIKAISDRLGVSRKRAGTLVMTESAFFGTRAQKASFEELNVEQYEIDAALDSSTCAVCGDMDGKHFAMSDCEPGATAPPFHPNCRCCIAPYFDDWEELGLSPSRTARDAVTGKTYDVPAGMKYPEWKDKQDAAHGAGTVDKERKRVIILVQTVHNTRTI